MLGRLARNFLEEVSYYSKRKAFIRQYSQFKACEVQCLKRFDLEDRFLKPCLDDRTATTEFDRQYVYHLAWAARKLKTLAPAEHIDISSYIYFSTMLSAFTRVKFYDYRPAQVELDNLQSEFADLTDLGFSDCSIKSLSCMHTVEHIGLGRYGDDLDYDGDLKAMKELSRVLAINGFLLFVVPVGNKSLIQFNAHRIYTRDQIVDTFRSFGLSLAEFTLIPELASDGGLVLNPSDELLGKQRYACGCFLLTKR